MLLSRFTARRTHQTMRKRVTVRSSLTAEVVALHSTLETHTPAVRARVDVLSLDEQVRGDRRADRRQALGGLDSELRQMSAERHALGSKMPSLRPRHISRLFRAGADLHGPVAVDISSLVADDLASVELQDGAGRALCGFRVVEGGHALFDGEGAGAEGQSAFFALEGGGVAAS